MKILSYFLFSLLFTLSACSQAPVAETEKDQRTIATSFYPLAFFTSQVVGENAEVVNLAGKKEVHEYSPTPQDMIRINNADLFIYQGAELEAWTEDFVAELESKGIATLEVAHFLTLRKMEEHEDEHEDEDAEDHHGEFDPHTWLDPVLAQDMVDVILASLKKLDPSNIGMYQDNADILKEKLAALDDLYASTLINCAQQEAITSHDAFGYLAARYGFELHSIAGISTHDEPSAQLLAKLKEEAEEEGLKYILTEENNIKRFAETLSRETGLTMIPIDPLSVRLNDNEDFLQGMTNNLSSLKTALECQ